MSSGEKTLFFGFVFLLILSTSIMLGAINSYIVVEKPMQGGSLKEGVIGFPRFVNPLLASSEADRDLVILVYSGLMKATPEGALIPDLASGYTVSDDGLEYIFTLKDNIVFHDGTPITTDDILFTVNKTKDPSIKSPKRANWEGVSVEKISEKEIRFTLQEPYNPFIENTTLGILPKYIWEKIDSEQFAFSHFNTIPVGSGPYQVKNVKRNSSGIPEVYSLTSFRDYALGTPHITDFSLHFFSNEEELKNAFTAGTITSINSISSEVAKELDSSGYRIEQQPLPRIFGVFLNQTQAPIFTHSEVRSALSIAVDREAIVEEVLAGYGTVITSPIPQRVLNEYIIGDGTTPRIERAIQLLEDAGWKLDENTGIRTKKDEVLKLTLATSNASELKEVAEMVKESWQQLGVEVTIALYEVGTLNQEVIRPRAYDALLFGEIVGRDLDLFAFWHSSQRNDPGLNIALYANIRADGLLEKIRTTNDTKERDDAFDAFEEEIQEDIPAIFIYSPNFIYALPKNLKGFSIGTITTPAERFLDVYSWYINTKRVWDL